MKAIGIHLPDKAQFSDPSDLQFTAELIKTIQASGRYRPIRLKLHTLSLRSEQDARDFRDKNDLVAIVEHDSSFHSTNARYAKNAGYLAKHVPLLNSFESQRIGHDKITTKRLLRERGIPVLDDEVLDSSDSLYEHMKNESLYVVKPSVGGAGAGVRLVKMKEGMLLRFTNGSWKQQKVKSGERSEGMRWISLQDIENVPLLLLVALFFGLAIAIPWYSAQLGVASMLFLGVGMYLFVNFYDRMFRYEPMLIEPYFNDSETIFSSLRCTVIGEEVVEAVKRTNLKNVTSNIANGGTAEKIELSEEQKRIAIAAKNAVGADYAGVDLLVRGEECVVGEVNIGPFTLFGTYTGVNVGKLFGEYLLARCDRLSSN